MTAKHKFINPNKHYGRLFTWLLPLFVIVLGWQVVKVNGQTSTPWSEPVNLSQSGAAAKPQLFVTADNVLHAIWQDDFAGYMYTRWITDSIAALEPEDGVAPYFPPLNDFNDEVQQTVAEGEGFWDRPRAITPPFGTRAGYPELQATDPTPLFEPVLVAAADNTIHAWWINEENRLFHSQVAAESLAVTEAWQARQFIRPDVIQVAAAVDISNTLHVAYVSAAKGTDEPAGVYYIQKESGPDSGWSVPIQLYESAYFRQLTLETANIQIIVDSNNSLFIVWDDLFQEYVYFGRSLDNGQTWQQSSSIDQRIASDKLDFPGPSKIKVVSTDDKIYLFWLAGHQNINCTVYYNWSDDNGESWNESMPLYDSLPDCPTSYQPIIYNGNLSILITTLNKSYISYLEDSKWREPQLQTNLNSFTNPNTFRTVTYTCKLSALVYLNRVIVIGCGVDNGQDVWVTEQGLSSFKPSDVETEPWSEPTLLTTGERQPTNPVAITDLEGYIHVFWLEKPVVDSSNNPYFTPSSISVYYTRYNDGLWSQPTEIIKSQEETIENFTIIFDKSTNSFFMVWKNRDDKRLLLSQVHVSRVHLSSEWSQPIQLPISGSIDEPAIAINSEGQLYISYVIKANENRGVFLISSSDKGESWSSPVSIINNTSDWGVFDHPKLTVTTPNSLHLIWTNRNSIDATNPATLYYSTSKDGGKNWSEPFAIQNRLFEARPVLWYDIQGTDSEFLHLVWQEWNRDRIRFWYQQSTNNGVTWNDSTQVFGFEQLIGSGHLLPINSNHAYLFQIIKDSVSTQMTLEQWFIGNSRRLSSSTLILDDIDISQEDNIACAITLEGRLLVVFSGHTNINEQSLPALFATERLVDTSTHQVNSLEITSISSTPTVTPTPEPSNTPIIVSPQPTAVDLNVLNTEVNQSPISSFAESSSLLIGGVLAIGSGIIVVVLFGIVKLLSAIRKNSV